MQSRHYTLPWEGAVVPVDGGSSEPEADIIVIGRAGVRAGYALLASMIVSVVVMVLLGGGGVVLSYPLLIAGATAWQLFVRGGAAVVLTAEALVVRSGSSEHSYGWTEILEASWRRHGSFWVGPGPVLRIRGGPYDEPGPNMPAQVASLPVFGRSAIAAAEKALKAAAQRHGVRFDSKMEQDIAMGRRRPQDPDRYGRPS